MTQSPSVDTKRNTLMNQMVVLRNNVNPNPMAIPSHIHLDDLMNQLSIFDKAKVKKMAKFKFDDLKRKSLHKLLFYSSKYVDLKNNSRDAQKIPEEILNILYSQKIKNYNPYIQTFRELSLTSDKFSFQNYIRIVRLCEIGVAKQILFNKKNAYSPALSEVGILIRNYMLNPMKKMIETKKKFKQNTTILHINNSALSYNHSNFPKELGKFITRKSFEQIIKHVNTIIEFEYVQYKLNNQTLNKRVTYSQYFITIFMICTVIFLLLKIEMNIIVEYGVMFFLFLGTVLGIVGSWFESKKRLQTVSSQNNITKKIQQKIQSYLTSVSDQSKLIWKVGKSFYWIQIQITQIRQRKLGDNDFF